MANAYGSITIVDIGDLGELSVTPMSNQPTMVTYSPDNGGSYNPSWGTSPYLVITPVIYYGSTKLTGTTYYGGSPGYSVVWKYRIGSGSETTITSGSGNYTITNDGSLQVSANKLSISYPNITYIVEVTYTDTASGISGTSSLKAVGQISFSLVQSAATLKMMTTTGESAFLYNSSQVCQNTPIVITAKPTGVTVDKWQYKNNGGSWVEITGTLSGITIGTNNLTLSVSDTATVNGTSVYNSDVGVFRALGSDSSVYDDHTIIKVRDGASGTSTYTVILSNEDQMVPCSTDGTPVTGAFNNCNTTVSIYEGNQEVTYSNWAIAVTPTSVGGSWDVSTRTYTASSLSANSGYVTFDCAKVVERAAGTIGATTFNANKTNYYTKDGNGVWTHCTNSSTYSASTVYYEQQITPIIKTFSLVKVTAGATPTIYSLECSVLAINKSISGVYSPASLTVYGYSQTGNNARVAYSGIFKFYKNGSTTASKTSSSATSSDSWTIASGTTSVLVELWDSTGATLYDKQTVQVVSDGATGADGLTFVLGNYSDVIPCTNGGKTAAAYTITIPFTAYQGTTRLACTATYSTSPTLNSSITATNTAGTASADGTLVFSIPASNVIGDAAGTKSGSITLTLTANGVTSTQTYTWTKNNAAANGTNAVIFELYTAEGGNVITSAEDTITVSPLLRNGTTTVTTGVTYAWSYYNNGSYTTITSTSSADDLYLSGDNVIAKANAVHTYLSLKCTATYSSKTYDAYYSLYDKTDKYQVIVLSTLGDKLVNSVGTGIIYTRVLRYGELYDEIKSTAVSTAATSAAFNSAVAQTGVTGADYSKYCWYVTASSIALYSKSGTNWAAVASANDPSAATYSWSGIHIVNNSAATIYGWGKNKAILLNGDIVNKKTMFNVQMTAD